MVKKWCITALGVLCMTAALVACSTDDEKGNANDKAKPANNNAPEPQEQVAKTYKVTMFNPGFGLENPHPERENDPARKLLEEKLNIELDFVFAPDQKLQKINTLIASGSVPDLIAVDDRDTAVKLFNQNAVVPLDDYLKDTPELVGAFEESRWTAMKYNNQTIGIPGTEGIGGVNGYWIRNDWLTKLKLAVPTTHEELFTVMKAFTFDDPDGNGKADTYGFAGGLTKEGKLDSGLEYLFWMFGVSPEGMDVVDGKVTVNNVDPRMKDALAYINRMVKEKVIDPDWVTINMRSQLDEKMNKGKVGVVVADWRRMEPDGQKLMQELGGEVPDWIQIAPPKGPNGDQILSLDVFQNGQWVISKKAAEDPDKVKRLLELLQYMYTDKEIYPWLAYGVKDVTWTQTGDQVAVTDKFVDKAYSWTRHYAFVRRANDTVYFNFKNENTSKNLELNQKYLKPNNVIPFLVPDPEDTIAADRTKYMREMMLKFITGKEPLTNWDAFVQTVNEKFQLNKLIEINTKQLQEQGILK
ncbi:extracellular solute-binding protein [Paenibacillus swuensis]|nr:extracellular solute-binding protein [Paenibacillus swuensis]